jgi:2-dehydro-3-deoxyphosphogalactonate aldolase
MKAGIHTFGLGSSLYKPGMTPKEVAERAKATIHAYDLAIQEGVAPDATRMPHRQCED